MKNKSKVLFFSTLAVAAMAIGAAVFASHRVVQQNLLGSRAGVGPYELTITEVETDGQLEETYQDNVEVIVPTELDNDLNLNFVMAKASAGNLAELGHRGMIYNFGTELGRITGITSIEANFSGNLYLKTSSHELATSSDHGAFLDGVQVLTSGNALPLSSPAKYFALIAGDSGAVIEDLTINYTCSDPGVAYESLIGTYTGEANGTVYQLDVSLEATVQKVVLKSLTAQTPVTINGTTVLSGNRLTSTFNFMSTDFAYVSEIQQNGRLLKFISVTPDGYLPHVDFYRVYDVENFDSYGSTGQGWDHNHTDKTVTTGLRSHWYNDFYQKDSSYTASPLGGTDWVLMASTDYLTFGQNKGRSGHAGVFKGNSTGLRFIQMNAYYGVPASIGRGAKLSFFAAGPYTNSGLSAKSANAGKVKVYAFYNTQVTKSNQSYRTEYEFDIPANSDWTEYTMNLDASKNYYAIGLYLKPSGQGYLPVDDFKIYTYSPYDVYTPVTGVEIESTAEVDAGKTVTLTPTFTPANASNKHVTWSSSDTNVATVDSNGVVTGVAAGSATITVTTEDGGHTDTCAVTVNPAPVYLSGTFVGSVTINVGANVNLPFTIASGDQGYIDFAICGVVTGVTKYTCDGSTFSIITKNTVTVKINSTDYQVTSGTLTGSIADGTFKNCSFSGTKVNDNSVTPTNNGSISCVKQDGSNSLFNNCDGSTSELQAVFGRRKLSSGSFVVDTTDADRILASSEHFMDGTGALVLKTEGSGTKSTLTLNSDLPEAYRSAFKNISFWVYNNSSSVVNNVNLFIYKGANFQNNSQITSVNNLQPGEWRFVTCGYSATIYNLQVYTEYLPANTLYLDNFCLYNS